MWHCQNLAANTGIDKVNVFLLGKDPGKVSRYRVTSNLVGCWVV